MLVTQSNSNFYALLRSLMLSIWGLLELGARRNRTYHILTMPQPRLGLDTENGICAILDLYTDCTCSNLTTFYKDSFLISHLFSIVMNFLANNLVLQVCFTRFDININLKSVCRVDWIGWSVMYLACQRNFHKKLVQTSKKESYFRKSGKNHFLRNKCIGNLLK